MTTNELSIQQQFIQFSRKHLPGYLVKYLEYPIVFRTLNRLLCVGEILELKEKMKDIHSFGLVDALVSYAGLRYTCHGVESIPRSGRVLIVANHPLGGADWLLIVQCVSALRKDIKVVINRDVDTLIANMRDLFIPVDTYAKFNDQSRKLIGESLEREEAVLLFPSGGISIMTSQGVRDRKWKNGVVHFARDNKTDVLPVYIGGRFSIAFYLYPIRLRRFLLVRNLLHPPSKNVRLVIGELISHEELSEGDDLSSISARLRTVTYKLARLKRSGTA